MVDIARPESRPADRTSVEAALKSGRDEEIELQLTVVFGPPREVTTTDGDVPTSERYGWRWTRGTACRCNQASYSPFQQTLNASTKTKLTAREVHECATRRMDEEERWKENVEAVELM